MGGLLSALTVKVSRPTVKSWFKSFWKGSILRQKQNLYSRLGTWRRYFAHMIVCDHDATNLGVKLSKPRPIECRIIQSIKSPPNKEKKKKKSLTPSPTTTCQTRASLP